jgi:C4-dicarboxylate-specific signal transduction histidine kinase
MSAFRGKADMAVTIQRQLTDRLPSIHGDRIRLQQVILNLMVNAIQASGLTKGIRELHIGTENAEEDGVRIGVRDTGPGLSGEPSTSVRAVLHNEAKRHGHGTFNLPVDH